MEKKYENDEVEIDLVELFFELLAHWKALLLSMVLVGAIAFSYTEFMVTPQYESTSELYVLSDTMSISDLTSLQVGTSLTNDYIVIVKSRAVLEQVIANLDLEENFTSLQGKISVNNPTNSRILDITVTDPDPDQAKLITDEIATVSSAFIADKMKQDPPNVLQFGYSDNSPVSPSILKNTAIGIVIGFLLAAAIIVITYLMNDSIMSPDDLEKIGINVLASLPLEVTEYDGDKRHHKKSGPKKKIAKSA